MTIKIKINQNKLYGHFYKLLVKRKLYCLILHETALILFKTNTKEKKIAYNKK
jgi:hypothetical protein